MLTERKVVSLALVLCCSVGNAVVGFTPSSCMTNLHQSSVCSRSPSESSTAVFVLKEPDTSTSTTKDVEESTSSSSASSASTSASAAAAMDATKWFDLDKPQKREKILKEPELWQYNFGLQDPKITLPHNIVRDVTPPETYKITAEQIQTLEEDGVVLIKRVLDPEWVEYLRAATKYQTENPHFWAFAGTASKLYDYIQRNIWQTNRAFSSFYYHSALGDVLRQCGKTNEIRISTDLLMVNPNKGFKWHQDNQNGPITTEDGIRFWITMDETPAEYGAPVYLKGSHRNTAVDPSAVFIDIDQPGLEEYRNDWLEFKTQPGDMLIWHPKTIHKIDGPADGIWTTYRRVLGGTVAKGGTKYTDKRGTGGVLSDLGGHTMLNGDKLDSPYFPIIYPQFCEHEAAARDKGNVGRSFKDIVSKVSGLASSASTKKFNSFFQVLGKDDATKTKSS